MTPNPAHLHLIVNHLPVMGLVLAVPLVLLAIWRHTEPAASIAAVLVIVLAGGGALLASNTGHDAEDFVEDIPGFEEDRIEEHEEWAEAATVLSVATAAFAIGALAYGQRGGGVIPRPALLALLAALLVTLGVVGRTAAMGGEIRHPEIRGPVPVPEPGPERD